MPKRRYEGTHGVAWTSPSSRLEPLSGTFTFSVFTANQPLGVPDTETTHDRVVAVFHTATRFVTVAALALLVGAIFFVAAIWPGGAESWVARRVVGSARAGLVDASLGILVSFGPYAAWAPLSAAPDPRLLDGTSESGVGAGPLSRLCVLALSTVAILQLMTGPLPGSPRERSLRGATVLGAGHGRRELAITVRTGDGGTQTFIRAIDVA